MKVNMKLHIEMLLRCLEKSELWKYIAFGPQSQTNHGTRMIQQRFLIELCALLDRGSGNSVTSVWLINTELMGRTDQEINHGGILQNKARESSPTCPALLPEKHPVLICGETKTENLLPPLGPCFTLKNLCPSSHWNTSSFTFSAVSHQYFPSWPKELFCICGYLTTGKVALL